MADAHSIKSWHEIQSSGKLRKTLLLVTRAVYEAPGSTQNEIWRHITDVIGCRSLGHSISPRFCTLVRRGAIRKGETDKICSITGKEVTQYFPTFVMPVKLEESKAPTLQKLYNAALRELEQVKAELARAQQDKTEGRKPNPGELDMAVEKIPSKQMRHGLCLRYLESNQKPADWVTLTKGIKEASR